jgi:hypothetical protein
MERLTIIRPRGAGYVAPVSILFGAAVIALLAAARALYEANAMVYPAVAGAIFFAILAAKIATLRVTLSADGVRCTGLLRRARTMRLDQIGIAEGVARKGYRGIYSHFLRIEPLDRRQRPMAIPTNYFTHADVQAIRNFLAEHLQRRHR